MGNKPAGKSIKNFFSDVGHGIENTFHDIERRVEPVVNRLGQTGEKALGVVDHGLDGISKIEDSVGNATKAIGDGLGGIADWFKNPILLPAIAGIALIMILKK